MENLQIKEIKKLTQEEVKKTQEEVNELLGMKYNLYMVTSSFRGVVKPRKKDIELLQGWDSFWSLWDSFWYSVLYSRKPL